MDLTASSASLHDGKKNDHTSSLSGIGETLTMVFTRIPSLPSDPKINCLRSGPAAEAGKGGQSIVPCGVWISPPAKRLSILP